MTRVQIPASIVARSSTSATSTLFRGTTRARTRLHACSSEAGPSPASRSSRRAFQFALTTPEATFLASEAARRTVRTWSRRSPTQRRSASGSALPRLLIQLLPGLVVQTRALAMRERMRWWDRESRTGTSRSSSPFRSHPARGRGSICASSPSIRSTTQTRRVSDTNNHDGNFGAVTSDYGPRTLQLGGKFVF